VVVNCISRIYIRLWRMKFTVTLETVSCLIPLMSSMTCGEHHPFANKDIFSATLPSFTFTQRFFLFLRLACSSQVFAAILRILCVCCRYDTGNFDVDVQWFESSIFYCARFDYYTNDSFHRPRAPLSHLLSGFSALGILLLLKEL
jgi:hypothetical protein